MEACSAFTVKIGAVLTGLATRLLSQSDQVRVQEVYRTEDKNSRTSALGMKLL